MKRFSRKLKYISKPLHFLKVHNRKENIYATKAEIQHLENIIFDKLMHGGKNVKPEQRVELLSNIVQRFKDEASKQVVKDTYKLTQSDHINDIAKRIAIYSF